MLNTYTTEELLALSNHCLDQVNLFGRILNGTKEEIRSLDLVSRRIVRDHFNMVVRMNRQLGQAVRS